MNGKKILIIRFSSIGDVVLTTPVIRCLKNQLHGSEIHFVTKASFRGLLENNPYVDKLHTFSKDVTELYDQLRAEKFDLVIDLHRNLRSLRLKQKLGVKSHSFDKINLRKLMAVNFKMLSQLPSKHIVDRYMETVKELGVMNDGKGLDFFLAEKDEVNAAKEFFSGKETSYLSLVIGGSYETKKIPPAKLAEICSQASLPVLLMGGPEDKTRGEELSLRFPNVINTCGRFSISQSASLIRQASWVITSDTGLMHIASAYSKRIISVWGNTIPEFGMGPYHPTHDNIVMEVKGLKCRPCSKLGYKKCPLGHFKCMNDLDFSLVSGLQ